MWVKASASEMSAGPMPTLTAVPRTCVFCGRSPVTREHVWPRWARVVWETEGQLPHFQQVVQEDRADLSRDWRQHACSTTVTVVCQACNNGWMADLEQRAKPMLEPMLQGRGRQLHAGGQRTLAAWALKTAMMIEHTHGAVQHVIPREDYADLMKRLEPSARVLIWMAAYGGETVAMGRMLASTQPRRRCPTLTGVCAISGARPSSSVRSFSSCSAQRSPSSWTT